MSADKAFLYQRFFNISQDMFCVAGHDGYFKVLNPAWEHHLGYSEEELLSRPYISFVHPDDRDKTQAEGRKLYRGFGTKNFENRYLCKDGHHKWLSWRAVVDEDDTIFATARDCTVRKVLQECLETNLSRLQTISEFLPVMVWSIDTEGNYVYANDAWTEFVGARKRSSLQALWSNRIHPEDVKPALETFKQDFEARRRLNIRYRLRRRDGEYRYVKDRGGPWYDSQGNFMGYVGVCSEVTDRDENSEDYIFPLTGTLNP